MVELVGEGVLIEFDPQAGTGRERDVAVLDLEGLCDVPVAEADLLLAEAPQSSCLERIRDQSTLSTHRTQKVGQFTTAQARAHALQ